MPHHPNYGIIDTINLLILVYILMCCRNHNRNIIRDQHNNRRWIWI